MLYRSNLVRPRCRAITIDYLHEQSVSNVNLFILLYFMTEIMCQSRIPLIVAYFVRSDGLVYTVCIPFMNDGYCSEISVSFFILFRLSCPSSVWTIERDGLSVTRFERSESVPRAFLFYFYGTWYAPLGKFVNRSAEHNEERAKENAKRDISTEGEAHGARERKGWRWNTSAPSRISHRRIDACSRQS